MLPFAISLTEIFVGAVVAAITPERIEINIKFRA